MSSLKLLDAIGNTPLVELRKVVPTGSARVVAKLESANPTGSMKDRVARALVERAAADGRLAAGGTVVEYTAGTTGISLALVCAALGYRAHFVFSDAFSDEGIGIGFIPPLWKANEVNEIVTASTVEAQAMSRRLAREEAIFAGFSTGANVVAALRVAEQLGPSATVAAIVVDSGLRYLSTDVYRA